jgi:hypothetical protein
VLRPARSARDSWEIPATSRCCRSSSPNRVDASLAIRCVPRAAAFLDSQVTSLAAALELSYYPVHPVAPARHPLPAPLGPTTSPLSIPPMERGKGVRSLTGDAHDVHNT